MRPIKYKTEGERVAAKRKATRLRVQRLRLRHANQAGGASRGGLADLACTEEDFIFDPTSAPEPEEVIFDNDGS